MRRFMSPAATAISFSSIKLRWLASCHLPLVVISASPAGLVCAIGKASECFCPDLTHFWVGDDLLCDFNICTHLHIHCFRPVSYTHLRAHETDSYLVCRLLLEKKKKNNHI